ncbi:adhesion G protein-coupled receptor G3 isoform 1-T1 [Chlamydotis macqueenii]
MARGSQETPQSSMTLLLGTVLLLLLLPDAARGQESCATLERGDKHHWCCNIMVESEERSNGTISPDLPQRCSELGHSGSPACTCLRERWLRLLQSAESALHNRLAGLKVLLLNVSRAITRDVIVTFSPTEGPGMLNTTEKGKAGKIQLPREIFQSLGSQTARVVVTVLNVQQLGMFKEVNHTGQVLDNTVVGITVGETSISGLRDPVQLTFAHGQLPRDVTPQCVFWDLSKGTVLGGAGRGCCARRSWPSSCACCRAGRRLEQQWMCHAARGEGDSLLLRPSHLLHPPPEPSSGQVHGTNLDGCCHRWLCSGHGFLSFHHCPLHLLKVQVQVRGDPPHQPGAAHEPRGQPAPPQPGLPAQQWACRPDPAGDLQGPGGAHPLLPALLLHLDGAGGLPPLPPLRQGSWHLHPPLPGEAVPAGLGLPCSRGGGGRSHRQLRRIRHPDHGPPGHSPPVLDHFQISLGPLHHQLQLLRPRLPLQHGYLRGGDTEELLPAGHRGGAGEPQGLEGGSGGDGTLLPAGSHLDPGVPHLRHLLCAHALPLHHPQLPPRNLHIRLVGRALLPEDEGDHWFPLPHHQT